MQPRNKLPTYCLVIASLSLLSVSSQKSDKLKSSVTECASYLLRAFHSKEPSKHEFSKQNDKIQEWLQKKDLSFKQAVKKGLIVNKKNSQNSFLVGKVIFRATNSYMSSLWIDVGEDNNPQNGPPIIAKNSPVLSGDSVVGVVDFVGKKSSLVRLISDSQLHIAVRASRGLIKNEEIISSAEQLSEYINSSKECFSKPEEEKAFKFLLSELINNISKESDSSFLAKGEIYGHSEPMFRTPGLFLKGSGFNYDFSDKYGPARDLRTGIIQVGDLLVTSGLDGIFPEGLKVAIVHSILPLQEGAFSFDILAKPCVLDLSDLSFTFILPPSNFSYEEIQDPVEKYIKQTDSLAK